MNIAPLPDSSTKDVPHGIVNLGDVIKIEGWAYIPEDSQRYPLPYVTSSSVSNLIGVYVRGANIRILTGIDRSGATKAYITLYYTKTS